MVFYKMHIHKLIEYSIGTRQFTYFGNENCHINKFNYEVQGFYRSK